MGIFRLGKNIFLATALTILPSAQFPPASPHLFRITIPLMPGGGVAFLSQVTSLNF